MISRLGTSHSSPTAATPANSPHCHTSCARRRTRPSRATSPCSPPKSASHRPRSRSQFQPRPLHTTSGLALILLFCIILPFSHAAHALDRRRLPRAAASAPQLLDDVSPAINPAPPPAPVLLQVSDHTPTPDVPGAKSRRQSGNSSAIMSDPNAPTTTPLPTPFDTNLGNNFTSSSCPLFFSSFLNDPKMQACHPISLLLTVSLSPGASPNPCLTYHRRHPRHSSRPASKLRRSTESWTLLATSTTTHVPT